MIARALGKSYVALAARVGRDEGKGKIVGERSQHNDETWIGCGRLRVVDGDKFL